MSERCSESFAGPWRTFSAIALAAAIALGMDWSAVHAQFRAGEVPPRLVIDPPVGFLRNPVSGANVEWYDASTVRATLRIYPFRAFAGDPARAFRDTLFGNWTELDPIPALASAPGFEQTFVAGAENAIGVGFMDVNGRSHFRIAVIAERGTAVALVHLTAETPVAFRQVWPTVSTVLSSMRVTRELPRLAVGGAETPAVAGLYLVPRINLMPGSGTGASTYYYLFSGDGRVYRGYGLPRAPAGNLARFDYAAAAQDDPENAGTFEVRGRQIVIRMGWQHPYTIVTAVPDGAGRITIENSTFSRRLW